MTDNQYDVLVIGAGPAGYVGAIRASQLGKKTALIEKRWIGGVCLNVGCIPSKSLLKNAEIARTLREKGREFGFSFDNLKLDYARAQKRSRQTSSRLTRGVEFLLKKNGVDVYPGTARLSSKNTVIVTEEDGSTTELTGADLIIATGASPNLIPGVEIDGQRVVTYRDAILQESLPGSAVIIGSGAIGVEFATIWNAYGVDVTIVEMLPSLVPLEDREIGEELEKSFQRSKIKVLTDHRVEDIQHRGEQLEIKVSGPEDEKTLTADQALIAIGFHPNTQGLGLDELGVELNQRGGVIVDQRMATNIPGIWAAGDVTDKLMLAHVGSAQGIVCAENIAGADTVILDYDFMPRATYSHPQIASFGWTEGQVQDQGLDYTVGRFPFQANGKALGLGDYRGWIKIISRADNGEILGAHCIGPEVTELLPELTLAHQEGIPIQQIARNVHAHPTLSEGIMEAAHDAVGHPIHT